jgi:hypothetical protein
MAELVGETVAHASGRKPGDLRWTELKISFTPAQDVDGAEVSPLFIADIIGETEVEGEERRVRRESFESVIAALAWGAFYQNSSLYAELRRKATAWLEARVRNAGMVSVSRMQSTSYTEGQETRDQKALRLLRELVEAANSKDDDRLDRAISEASDFLEEIDDAARKR